jgi:hypothetical protein
MFGCESCLFPLHFSLFDICIISVLYCIGNMCQSAGQTVMSSRSNGNWI